MDDESSPGVKRSVLSECKPWNPHGGQRTRRTDSPTLSSDGHVSAVVFGLSLSPSPSPSSSFLYFAQARACTHVCVYARECVHACARTHINKCEKELRSLEYLERCLFTYFWSALFDFRSIGTLLLRFYFSLYLCDIPRHVHVCTCLGRPEEGDASLGARVLSLCESVMWVQLIKLYSSGRQAVLFPVGTSVWTLTKQFLPHQKSLKLS